MCATRAFGFVLAATLLVSTGAASGQTPMGTVFTYQGFLEETDDGPVTAPCDFEFSLWDAESGGTELASTEIQGVWVLFGLFTVDVDFESDAFFSGDARWLGMAVCCPSYCTPSSLNGRQKLTPAPHALALPGLRTQQNATSPNLLGGYTGNIVEAGVVGATIGGGGAEEVPTPPAGACSGDADILCQNDEDCVIDNGDCVSELIGGKCSDDPLIFCMNDDVCAPGTCVPDEAVGTCSKPSTTWCDEHGDCPSGEFCIPGQIRGTCSDSPGTPCLDDGDCPTGTCKEPQGTCSENPAIQCDTDDDCIDDSDSCNPDANVGRCSDDPAILCLLDPDPCFGLGAGVCEPFPTINQVMVNHGTISGGLGNVVGQEGPGRQATGYYATVGGGRNNKASGDYSTVSGGRSNTASGKYSAIGGGYWNEGKEYGTTIAGGFYNRVHASYGTIAGGAYSKVTGSRGAILGGSSNRVAGGWGTVGGGRGNKASDRYGTVGGGYSNEAKKYAATIPGGFDNTVDADYSAIAGGYGNTVSGSYSAIAGGDGNIVAGRLSAVLGGSRNDVQGDYSAVAGGCSNQANWIGDYVGGGSGNQATGGASFVGGGLNNVASGLASTIGGGGFMFGNTAGPGWNATVGGGNNNTASGFESTVGGGRYNTASGSASTVPGGEGNAAMGAYSLAAGYRARADHQGAFVWADHSGASFFSQRDNQFRVQADGGARFDDGSQWVDIRDDGTDLITTSTGARLTLGGAWTDFSDRDSKRDFASVDRCQVLRQVSALPISTWRYKVEDVSIRHMGPTAQDFYSAFGLGNDDRHIAALDTTGVALAAIQGLYEIVKKKEAELLSLRAEKEAQVRELETRLTALEKLVNRGHARQEGGGR